MKIYETFHLFLYFNSKFNFNQVDKILLSIHKKKKKKLK